jgi:Zn-dependent protease
MHRDLRMVRDGSLTLFRVRGVPIRAHWTLLLIIPYLAASLAYRFDAIAKLSGVDPARVALPPFVWGLLLAGGLFVSVAIHELAHTVVAIHYGGRVRSITLMLLGGVSQLSRAPARPFHEAVMAAAGPATSLALAFGYYVGYATLADPDAQMALFYLAVMNVSLAVFNLLPAFPLDGGRVLRGLLATRLGQARATSIAAAIGKVCAIGLGLLAVLQGNLLLAIIAVFVYSGAAAEAATEAMKRVLADLRVTDMLRHEPPPVIDAGVDAEFALRRMAELDRLELVILDRHGPIGVIEASTVARLSPQQAALPIGALAPRVSARYVVVAQTVTASEALAAAAESNATYIVVVDPPTTVIGLIGPRDVARTTTLRSARRIASLPRAVAS